jgi:predicted metal-dependent hydrolase
VRCARKAVAFDALSRTYPGYFTRAMSGVLVFALFHVLLAAGTAYLLVRRRELFRWRTVADLWRFWVGQGMLAESLRAMGRYLTPAFHPWGVDDYALADKVLRALPQDLMPPLARDAAGSRP